MPFYIFPIAAFFLSVLFLWGGRYVALKYGFADKPGGRKKHDVPVPPIGGLVILPVFIAFAFFLDMKEAAPWPLLAGLLTLLVMGGIDDIRPINPVVKFIVMVWTCCFVVIFGQGQITTLGNLFGFGDAFLPLGWAAEAFTVLAIVLLMNAINMIDGVDGLAGGFCTLVVGWLMLICGIAGYMAGLQTLSVLLAPLLAFLVFNLRGPWRKKASIFLGDSGALCMGLVIGWFCIKISQPPTMLLQPAVVIWLIALPVMDAFGLFVARSLRGLHPFYADRRHLHHRFIDAGLSPAMTTWIMLGLFSLTALIGFWGQFNGVPAYVMFWAWFLVFTAHLALIVHPRGYTFAVRYFRMKGRKSEG